MAEQCFPFPCVIFGYSEEFQPRGGSVRRPGRKIIHAEFGLSSRLQQESNVGSLIRDVFPLFIADYTVLPNGETEVQLFRPQLEIEFQDGGAFQTQYAQNFKRADRRPCGIPLPAGDYRSNEFQVRYFSDKSEILSVDARYKKCDVFTAEKTTLTLGGKLQPFTRFSLSADYAEAIASCRTVPLRRMTWA